MADHAKNFAALNIERNAVDGADFVLADAKHFLQIGQANEGIHTKSRPTNKGRILRVPRNGVAKVEDMGVLSRAQTNLSIFFVLIRGTNKVRMLLVGNAGKMPAFPVKRRLAFNSTILCRINRKVI